MSGVEKLKRELVYFSVLFGKYIHPFFPLSWSADQGAHHAQALCGQTRSAHSGECLAGASFEILALDTPFFCGSDACSRWRRLISCAIAKKCSLRRSFRGDYSFVTGSIRANSCWWRPTENGQKQSVIPLFLSANPRLLGYAFFLIAWYMRFCNHKLLSFVSRN